MASFIDNVIIRIEEKKEYDEIVVEKLAENDLVVKPEKCKWKVKKVGFLEVVIGLEGIKMEEEKVKGVLDWLTLKGVKDIQKSLGLVNYYYQFIKDFAAIARPLYNMVKKDQRWKWTERQNKMFRKLKKRFTKELVLTALDLDKKMRIEVDTLNSTTGEVLFIDCEDRRWRPVAFLSKSLNEIERNYKIHNKEMLAVIRELENWRYLLEGAKFKFEVWTDHKNLEYFMKVQKLNRRQAHWAFYLSRFDFTLKHVPGTKMEKVDGLSRRPDWKVGVEKDNDNQVFIKDHWVHSLAKVIIEGLEVEIVEKIKKARSKDEEVVRVVEEIKNVRVKVLQGDEWQIEGELVLEEGKVYILKDKELRVEIIWLHYNVPVAGYGGR